MLKTVLSVSGKPGLYKMISQGKNLMVIESLSDKKRVPAYSRDKVISLGDIIIYAAGEDVPLYKVLNSIKEKENLQKISIDFSRITPDELRAYFAEVLPEFDRERVYPTDIKRLMNWYNILLDAGITEFDPEEATETKPENEDTPNEEDAQQPNEEVKKAKEEVKKVTKTPKPAAPKITTPKSTATSKPPSASKMRQRTKQK